MITKKILGYILIAVAAICTAISLSPMIEQGELVSGSLMETTPLLYWPLVIGMYAGGGGITLWMLVAIAKREKGKARLLWIIGILIASWFGAAAYFIIRYSKKRIALEPVGSAPIDMDND